MLSDLPRSGQKGMRKWHMSNSRPEAGLGTVEHCAEDGGDEHVACSGQHIHDHREMLSGARVSG